MVFINKIGDKLFAGLENLSDKFFGFWENHKIGILGTIAVHLLIIILFLVNKLESNTQLYISTILVDMKKDYSQEIIKKNKSEEGILPDDAIKADQEVQSIRNFAVDATESDLNPSLTDDKNINASELYEEANRLKQQLDKSKEMFEDLQTNEIGDIPNTPQKIIVTNKEEGQFKGPSVISYYLKNRKAIKLPVPAYKCQFGGRVVVDIEVDENGLVKKASVDSKNSVQDECINNAALKAATESLFTSISISDNRQKGSITYMFVPQ